jgi:septum formation protein
MRLILASASPRRAELLAAAGYAFEVVVTDVDESVRAGEVPRDYVHRLSTEKSRVALERRLRDAMGQTADASAFVVVGADTAVVIDDEILGKPTDEADAERMLRKLAGRTHTVLTGVSVRTVGDVRTAVEATTVTMAALDPAQISWYVRSREGWDKAGAYAIQGLASRFVERIDGSYSNVVGLPVAALDRLLRTLPAPSSVLASEG